ncbi:YjcZ family sporulation protein [Paenibacillus sp. p3-SID1389]|nr:YjcZ family sporulation protein [Paenibacillus sp. p3-SID1389]MCT2194679.1 YjcZ family sporulation protein [Paenibacillus sp. p3-SID1389]
MSGIEEARGGYGGGYGGLFTSTGVILVLFILLVIVSRSILY